MKNLNIGSYSKGSKIKSRVNSDPEDKKPKRTKKVKPSKSPSEKKSIFKKIIRKPSKRFLMIAVGVLTLSFVIFGYLRIQEVSSRVEKYDEGGNKVECTNILNPECWTDAFKPQLKQTDGYTNGLVVGLDTRTGGSGSLKNTDTIMFFSFNHQTQETMIVSIPRDTYIPKYVAKINAIYAYTLNKNPEDPFFYLKETISEMLGKPIHYFGTVRFEGVTDAIDEIGGVEVCIEDTLRAQYPNDKATPTSPDQWLFYDFEEGCQQLDGEHALVWSRFRYVAKGPSSYASDFSRARRQQQVLEAAKDKLLGDDSSVSEKAEYYWSLMQSFSDSVTVYDVAFEDLLAGLAFLDTADRDPINVVLDPALGGYNQLIYATSSSATGYIIRAKDESYQDIRDYIDLIWANSAFWKESPRITVRNATGEQYLPDEHPTVVMKNEMHFYEDLKYFNEAEKASFAGIKIFDFSGGQVDASLKYLSDFLGIEISTELPEIYGFTRENEEDILIVVGPDTIEVVEATPDVTE